MLTLEVKNIRGVRAASIPIGTGITFLAGRNRAGKSSLLTALGALLSAERAPMTGGVKFDAEHIVARGEKQAAAQLSLDEANRIVVRWKASGTSEIVTEGEPPTVSRLCSGLDLFSELDKGARLKLLAGALEAKPTLDQLKAECRLASDEALAKLKGQIKQGMWDDACATCDGEAKQSMGGWRQITNKTWTERVGEEWAPDGLTADPKLRTRERIEALRATITDLKAKRAGLSGGGVSAEDRAALVATAGELPTARARLEHFSAEMAKADQERQAAQLALSQVHEPGTPAPTCACPCCGETLDVSTPTALKRSGSGLTKEELAAQKKAYLDARQKESIATSGYQGFVRDVATIRAHVGRCEQAAAQLAALPAEDAPQGDDGARDRITAEIDAAMAEGKALTAWLDARDLHSKILMWVELRAACAPDGLRRTVLKKKLDGFNARLAQWAADLRGTVIKIDEDMVVRDGNDEPYRVLSGAEKWLSDALIMLAIAEIEAAPVVVIDEANMLDDQLRGPFITQVLAPASQDRMVVVACAAGFVEKVPDLGKHGLGCTFWIDQGEAQELGRQLAAE